MKKTSVPAVFLVIFALLIAVGSVSFLGPCVHEDGSFGACHWAGQAMLGIGLLLCVLSIAALICWDDRMREGFYLSGVLTAVLGILTPGRLIALCGMATMRCRAVMRPAMLILCILWGAVAVIGMLLCEKTKKK